MCAGFDEFFKFGIYFTIIAADCFFDYVAVEIHVLLNDFESAFIDFLTIVKQPSVC